jgi:hypothetical protein
MTPGELRGGDGSDRETGTGLPRHCRGSIPNLRKLCVPLPSRTPLVTFFVLKQKEKARKAFSSWAKSVCTDTPRRQLVVVRGDQPSPLPLPAAVGESRSTRLSDENRSRPLRHTDKPYGFHPARQWTCGIRDSRNICCCCRQAARSTLSPAVDTRIPKSSCNAGSAALHVVRSF